MHSTLTPKENLCEFLLTKDAKIVPVEVKAGNSSSVSLNELLKRPEIEYGCKLIAGNVSVSEKRLCFRFIWPCSYKCKSLPAQPLHSLD